MFRTASSRPARRTAFTSSALFACALAPLAALGSCSSTGVSSAPSRLIELFDMAAPAGGIEVELARDGTIRELEAEVPVEDLPEVVVEVAMERLPEGRIVRAEREINAGGEFWEVEMVQGDESWQFVIDEDAGAVRESEQPMPLADAPPAVLGNAASRLRSLLERDVEPKSLDRIELDGEVIEYHVKFELEGASYKVVTDADGRTRRAVREQRAELEIPLK